MKLRQLKHLIIISLVCVLCSFEGCGESYIDLSTTVSAYNEENEPLKDIRIMVYKYPYDTMSYTYYNPLVVMFTQKDGSNSCKATTYTYVKDSGVVVIATDASNVYLSDTIVRPKMWKTKRGERRGYFEGEYETRCSFKLKKKE